MLSLYHLHYFAKAAEFKSIANAAKQLHVTPSAISQAIQSLERDLDAQLISHRRNSFELTATGALLFERAQALLTLASAVKNDIHLAEGREEGEFIFLTHQSIAGRLLPEVMRNFTKRYPAIKPSVQIGTREQIFAALPQNLSAFAIILGESAAEKYERKTLRQGVFVLVGRKKALSGEQCFILSDFDTPEIKILRAAYLRKFRKELPVALTVKSWSVCLEMASVGIGIAYVPEYVLERVGSSKLQRVPWEFSAPEVTYTIDAIWPKGQALCGCATRFLEMF